MAAIPADRRAGGRRERGALVGLVFAPIGIAAAGGLVLLMTGALASRIRVHDAAPFLLGDGTFIVLAAATAITRIASA